MKQFIVILAILFLFCDCCKKKDLDTIIQLYKFKSSKDYSNHVPVELSEDEERIASAPGTINRLPVKLADDYYMNGSMGVNSGYLSMTIEEHNSYEIKPGVDSIYKMIVEKDPYIEYYHRNDDGTFRNENGVYGIDTTFINDLIRTDKLEEYFDKLK